MPDSPHDLECRLSFKSDLDWPGPEVPIDLAVDEVPGIDRDQDRRRIGLIAPAQSQAAGP